jgi:hypothetical protein
VIELDEVGDHYEGTAVAWDEQPGSLNALIRFGTSSKGNTHHIGNIPVIIIDNNGDTVSGEFLKNMKDSSGVVYPATVAIDIALRPRASAVAVLIRLSARRDPSLPN